MSACVVRELSGVLLETLRSFAPISAGSDLVARFGETAPTIETGSGWNLADSHAGKIDGVQPKGVAEDSTACYISAEICFEHEISDGASMAWKMISSRNFLTVERRRCKALTGL